MKWLKTFDEDFVRENFKDKTLAESIIRDQQKRYTTTIIVLISFLVVAMIAFIYAGIKIYEGKSIETEYALVLNENEQCIENARQEMINASNAAKANEEKHKAISEQLLNCSPPKSKKK